MHFHLPWAAVRTLVLWSTDVAMFPVVVFLCFIYLSSSVKFDAGHAVAFKSLSFDLTPPLRNEYRVDRPDSLGSVDEMSPTITDGFLLSICVCCWNTAGTISQLFEFGQSECSVVILWSYTVATFSLTLWSSFFMWLVSWVVLFSCLDIRHISGFRGREDDGRVCCNHFKVSMTLSESWSISYYIYVAKICTCILQTHSCSHQIP